MISDSLAIAGRETLYEHPGTGAATELVEILRRDKLEPLGVDAALAMGAPTQVPTDNRGWSSIRAAGIFPCCASRGFPGAAPPHASTPPRRSVNTGC